MTSILGLGKMSQFLQINLFLKDIVTLQSISFPKFSIFSTMSTQQPATKNKDSLRACFDYLAGAVAAVVRVVPGWYLNS